jgi:hypothetical protein
MHTKNVNFLLKRSLEEPFRTSYQTHVQVIWFLYLIDAHNHAILMPIAVIASRIDGSNNDGRQFGGRRSEI